VLSAEPAMTVSMKADDEASLRVNKGEAVDTFCALNQFALQCSFLNSKKLMNSSYMMK
jgi:hypothetical protein